MKMNGLTKEEVIKRKQAGLINTGTVIKTKSIGQILYTNIFTWFNLLNILIAIGIILTGSYKNTLFLGVVVWNAVIGIFQEIRSKTVIDRLSVLASPTASVIRDGKKEKVSIDELVLDDICEYVNGSQICADSIILEGKCEVNESLLTGESEPVFKKEGDEILSGSFVVSGRVYSKIIHVGNDNYVNNITKKAKYIKKINSEILLSTKKFVKIVSFFILPIFALLFLKQVFVQNSEISEAYISSSAAIIGMIPSGLILLCSMVMALSTIRLGRKNILVQEMYCVETLARVNVLCLDKTGTITEGKMQVKKFVSVNEKYDDKRFKGELAQYIYAMENDNQTSLAIKDILKQPDTLWNCVERREFSSEKKWGMASFENSGSYYFGAAEKFVDKDDENLKDKILQYQKQGNRVLGFAKSYEDEKELLGYVVISDMVKKDVNETFEFLKKQGIKIKVLSGDNVYTVASVAMEAGVEDADKYIDASSLDTDKKVKKAALEYNIFGRVTPNQKCLIVEALKEAGYVTGMVGDGTNDVMAVKESDCSIAMKNGSEAAGNVSNIILLNSDFESIPQIFNEGRRDINNLQRSSALFLMKTVFSIAMAIIFMILPFTYPFEPIQMTLISSTIIGIPSFILALEPNYNIVKGKFFNNVLRKAVPAGLSMVINTCIALFVATVADTSDVNRGTWVFVGLMCASMVELFVVCRPFNIMRTILVVLMYGVLFVCIFAFGNIFSLEQITFEMIIYGLITYIIMLIVRMFMLKKAVG